jgi:RNA polymerase sigma-70 factor (ECF subfamily)
VNNALPSGENNSASEQFVALYQRHVDMVYRVCYTYLRNTADTEDAVQNVFVKVLTKAQSFASAEHEKAWLIRVATNHCKDVLKSGWSKRTDLDSSVEPAAPDSFADANEILAVVMELPEMQRVCIYLYYYEGYNAAEIAKMMDRPHSTIRNHLSDARKALKEKLEGGFDE